MDRIEGTSAPGEKLVAYTKRSPSRAFPVRVTEYVPGQRMTWTGGMPLGLFKGVRTFSLTAVGDRNLQLTLREEFSGPLLPMIAGSLPDLTPTFEAFVAGLKARAEQGTATSGMAAADSHPHPRQSAGQRLTCKAAVRQG